MKIFICMLFLFAHQITWAAEEKVEVVPSDKKEKVFEDTSEHHRLDKKWTFNAQLVGIGPSYATQRGLVGGYFLNRNMVVQAEVMGGELYSESIVNAWSSGSLDVDGRSFGAHFKHYVGNSFYYRAGLDWRSLKYRFADTFSGTSGQFDGTSLAVTFNIGNQWQWSNFTLGCDWVGLSVPLSKSFKNELLVTGTSYDANDFDEDKELLVSKTNLNLVRFYIGASF
jgi:hypothetical protein